MRRRRLATQALAAASCIGIVAGGARALAFAADAADGLALYGWRRDAAAIERLASARRQGEASMLARLALTDLYFMSGRTARARRELESLVSDGFDADEATVWLTWLDFASGRAVRAERTLTAFIDEGVDPAVTARAALSLGLQRLLRGRTTEATTALEQVGADPLPEGIAQHALLLRGESLMWSRQYRAAEAILMTVAAGSLRADAARDVAWCHYQLGETERARTELGEVAQGGDSGHSSFPVDWPTVVRHGPRVLARKWRTAFRNRPRGQDPVAFMLAATDRDAAADAQALLASIDWSRPPAAIAVATIDRKPGAAGVTAPDLPTPQKARVAREHRHGTLALRSLAALAMIALTVRALTRRRGRT